MTSDNKGLLLLLLLKAFIFNKNEGNNQKVENKVSGRVLHYVKIAGCSAMYTNVTCCK